MKELESKGDKKKKRQRLEEQKGENKKEREKLEVKRVMRQHIYEWGREHANL